MVQKGQKVIVLDNFSTARRSNLSQHNKKNVKKDFKWKPKITIEKGIEMLLKKISSWKAAKVWTPEKIKEETKTWFEYLNKG